MVNDIMSKKISSFWRLLLGSLITMLGFAACKTTKDVSQKDETAKLYGPPPTIINQKPIDQLKPLYGVPPVRIEREPQVKD